MEFNFFHHLEMIALGGGQARGRHRQRGGGRAENKVTNHKCQSSVHFLVRKSKRGSNLETMMRGRSGERVKDSANTGPRGACKLTKLRRLVLARWRKRPSGVGRKRGNGRRNEVRPEGAKGGGKKTYT